MKITTAIDVVWDFAGDFSNMELPRMNGVYLLTKNNWFYMKRIHVRVILEI
jgi:hypothetical protein